MLLSNLARSAMVNSLTMLFNEGFPPGRVEIFSGSAPANTTDADSGTKLATCVLSVASFGAAFNGLATANNIAADTNVDATGIAGHFRIRNAAGVVVLQGSVGVSGADMNFDSTAFIMGGTATITSMTIFMPAT